jgi:caa(3)-type oxidase subunit IV
MSDPAQAHAHHHPNYVKIWAILCGLLVVSVVGPMFGIRLVTLFAAFGVALIKAYMVARNFMHLNVQKKVVHYALGLALVIMVLMYAGISPDVGHDSGQRWVKGAGWHHLPPQGETAEEGSEHGESGR